MIKVGNILWHPKLDVVIKITKIIEKSSPFYVFPWFEYEVLVTQKENNKYNFFTKGSAKHNGWDFYNIIGTEFILIHKYDKAIPIAYRLLYGS